MNHYVSLAKEAVKRYVGEGEIISPPKELPKHFFTKKAGVFVTIKNKHGGLRGCIGTYLPTRENIAGEIIYNAIAAATKDARFGPVKEKEPETLIFSVYILNPPEKIKNLSNLNPEKFGIFLKSEFNKSALLLPGLPGIDSPEQQFFIACQKGGMDPEKENVAIYRFTAEKHE